MTTIHDFPLTPPAVQPLPDGRVLAVGARARWRQDGQDRNATIYSADGTALAAEALSVDADTAWTCYYTDFPIVRVHEEALTGWHGGGAAANALITDGSRIALYGGYGADRDHLVAGRPDAEHRRMPGRTPGGQKLPVDALVIGRGPDLHILTYADWYRLDLSDVAAEP
ncbi:hypothetical protein GCM10010191_49570 [Actinomadura vinacea]|uniref:Uncharacterized protein n=1 Tax=Actinomadura vinacea TaxID=115336 RepID=A0ABP5WLP8_9ACTN